MNDYMVRAITPDQEIRAFAITGRTLTEKARTLHNTSPIVTAALGRTLNAGLMMGFMLKGEKDLITIRMRGTGPMGGLTVTADAHGHVKGYADVADVMLPPNSMGKLDVGGAMGEGILTVIKDMGLKEPYTGQVEIQTGEIAEDLTYYFAASEQVPSAVGLGVLMNKDNTVAASGGFIIQLMPYASEERINALEKRLKEIDSVTAMLTRGLTPEGILEEILGREGLEITEKQDVFFKCDCSRRRVEKALISLGKKELQDMIDEGKPITLNCHFCSKQYIFTVRELENLLEKAK